MLPFREKGHFAPVILGPLRPGIIVYGKTLQTHSEIEGTGLPVILLIGYRLLTCTEVQGAALSGQMRHKRPCEDQQERHMHPHSESLAGHTAAQQKNYAGYGGNTPQHHEPGAVIDRVKGSLRPLELLQESGCRHSQDDSSQRSITQAFT